jgi:Helix-turn-helix domain
MSVRAMTCVFETSPSKGTARTVELALADAVNEERIQFGSHALAWISQSTIARRCNCSRSSVERALGQLKSLGRIVDTGQRMDGRYRGTVVYRLPHAEAFDPDDLTHPGGTQSDVTQPGGGAEDLTHPGTDLTQFDDDLTHPGASPASTLTHKPVVEPAVEPAAKSETAARPPAREDSTVYPGGETDAALVAAQKDSASTRDYMAALPSAATPLTPAQEQAERKEKEDALAACDQLLAEGRGSSLTRRSAGELREELGIEAVAS